MYRPRAIAPYAYGLPQIQPRQAAPMGVSTQTTGDQQGQQRQQGNMPGFSDAASLYRMVKERALQPPMNPLKDAYHGDMALNAMPISEGFTPFNTAWAGDMALTANAGVPQVGMGMVPAVDGAMAGGGLLDAAALPAGAIEAVGGPLMGAEGLLGSVAGAGAGVAPAMGAAAPMVAEAALPAAAIEAVGAPAAAGGLAGLGALGPIGLGAAGIFGLGKLFDWW